MAKRKMSALQKKYFGKKHKAVHRVKVRTVRRKRVIMARRKGGYHRSFSKGIGGMKTMLSPIASGVLDSYLDPMLPIDGVGATIVGGFLLKNETMKNIGLYKIGFSLGNIIPLPGRSGGSQGALL
jgi:hypothetical protein